MSTQNTPTYEELKRRLEAAESALTAIREGRVDTILGEHETLVVRLAEAEETLARQLGFEQAVAAASTFLLSAKSSTAVVTDAIMPLLEVSGVSRMYIFENFDDSNDGLCMKQTFEVCALGITPEIDNPVLQHVVYAQGFERWRRVLSAGDAIRGHVSDFPGDEREILEPQGILSILVLPVFVEGKWWGFIGFDDTRQARDWDDSEVALLGTAAEMLGAYFTRKWTEETLEREHAMLARTEAVAHVGSWEWEAEGDKVTWSEELFRIFGLEPMEEAPPFAEHQAFYVPEDRTRLVKAVEECLQKGVPYDLEVRVTRSDGQLRHCVVRGIPERGADGAVKRLYGSLHDITERKRAEEALQNILMRFNELAANVPVGVYVLWLRANRHLEFEYVSDRWCEIHQLKREDVLSDISTVNNLVHPDDQDDFVLRNQESFRNRIPFAWEGRFLIGEGTIRWLRIESTPSVCDNGDIRWFGATSDITERKQAEEKLSNEREQLLAIFNSIDEVIYISDPITHELLYANDYFKKLLPSEPIGAKCYKVIQNLDAPCPFCTNDIILKQNPEPYTWAFYNENFDRHYAIVDRIIRWSDGRDVRFEIAIDVTERKQAEEALRASAAFREQVLEIVSDGFLVADLEGRVVDSNEAYCRMSGYTSEELCSLHIKDLNAEETPEQVKAHFALLKQEGTLVFETLHRRKDGSVYPVEVCAAFMNEAGEYFIGFFRDITERKQAEKALRESESRVRTKLNALLDPEGDIGTLNLTDVVDCDEIQSLMNDFHALTDIGVGILDLDGTILVASGWQDVCMKFHRVHPETAKNCRESDTALASGVEPGTFKIYKCKNNMWDMVTPIMIGGKHVGNLFLGQFFFDDEAPDIATFREQARRYGFDEAAYLEAYYAIPRWSRETVDQVMTFYCNLIGVISRLSYAQIKLARASEALRKSEGKFRALVDNTIDWIWETDANGRYTYVSENIHAILGYNSEKLLGRTPFDFMDKEETDRVRNIFQEIARKHERILNLEDTLLHKDGHPILFETNATPIIDEEGDLSGYFGTCRDITERKQAEEALHESERRLSLSTQSGGLGIWDWDIVNNRMTWDDQMFRLYGITVRPESYGVEIWETGVHPDDRDFAWEACQAALRGEKEFDIEFRVCWPDDTVRHIKGQGIVLRDDAGKPIRMLGINYDITERKQAEEERERLGAQLTQAQKMEAVGRLAGGVAHDFNNMLGIIIGHADMILEDMAPDQPYYADLTEIRKAGARSADLTRQLLAFARKQTVAPKVIDLNKTVQGMLKMLQRLIGEDIDMAWIPGGKVWTLKIDPGQVDQMLANLCVNARDAIADVGKVTIETGNTVFDDDYCRDHAGFVPGEYVMLAVSDNGCGMDSETLAKVFEPFFTTKELGKGTGLGLATVYGVVKQNNGLINVYSEPGQGTTFKIYLPRHQAKAAPLPEKGPGIPSARGHETVLLVEDEQAILKMTTMMLEREGYTVLGAGTPGEAIRLATEHAGDIHLLMTDVVMPEMNGRDLAKNILSLYPSLKCLFMSGYTANVIAHHGVLDEGVNFIQKPFSKGDLAVKVREALNETKEASQ